jgi:hypothetical protein
MTNLKLFVTEEDYSVFAGPDWPSYQDYLNGARGTNPVIQNEIDNFTSQQQADGIKFPINTATACQSKWTWSTIFLNQLSTSSCHRVNPVPFTLDEFDNFHNVPKKIADRELMLAGQWPTGGCEYCKKIEDSGGWSDRQHNLNIRGLTPLELETDPTATHVTPRLVEIFAQNTCNLACIYCNGNLSSRIEQENLKYGDFEHNGVTIPVITVPTVAANEYFERWISWLDNNVTQLKRLHLLGGETFLQHDLMTRVLDCLERNPNPELQFNIFSNFNVPDRYWNLYTEKIKDLQSQGHIGVFDLTASIDCWGPEASYIRSGLNLEKFETRLAWASEQGDWLRLNINQTITAMTIRTMPELMEKINYYKQNKKIGQYFEFYIGSDHYQHPENFAWSMWANDFERIFNLVSPDDQDLLDRISGIQSHLQQFTQHNLTEISRLHTYLDELDRRRGTNWRELFSYLDVNA